MFYLILICFDKSGNWLGSKIHSLYLVAIPHEHDIIVTIWSLNMLLSQLIVTELFSSQIGSN
jgi:hypothetical protein